ncbi:protein D3-like [Chironomus tepperi]|uniref:protein D3-like n=1 Tax=Chironomus tepperi TaxID=113505 RepID=UPI00391F9515
MKVSSQKKSSLSKYPLFLGIYLGLVNLNCVNMSASEAFTSNEIVPDILDDAPKELLKVSYTSGINLEIGSELTPTQVKDQPNVEYEGDNDAFYTLLLTDPDAPSRTDPKVREVRHWLVVNIPGNKVSEGETKWSYIGSGPPQGSNLHRYVFLLFKQTNGKQDFDLPTVPNTSRDGRLNTNTRELIKKYNLELVAGNFYQAQFDDYVPILHAQLGGAPKIN